MGFRFFNKLLIVLAITSIAGCGTLSKFTFSVDSDIVHNECNNNECSGSIKINDILIGGNPVGYSGPFVFADATGNIIQNSSSNQLSGACNGVYNCGAKLFSNTQVPFYLVSYSIGFYINNWNLQNMAFNSTTKTLENSPANSSLAWALSDNFLSANEDGYITFEYATTNTSLGAIAFGFCDANNSSNTYQDIDNGFALLGSNGQVAYAIVENGVGVGLTAIKGAKEFKIERKGNKVFYYIDGKQVHYNVSQPYTTVNPNHILRVKAWAKNNNLKIKNATASFCRNFASVYASLAKELDGSYYLMKNSILFKYKEKYNDEELDFKVYNWKRELILSNNAAFSPVHTVDVTNTNHSGVNYHSILVNNKLEIDEYYVLEVTNNKGEVYKMRFRYDAIPVKN